MKWFLTLAVLGFVAFCSHYNAMRANELELVAFERCCDKETLVCSFWPHECEIGLTEIAKRFGTILERLIPTALYSWNKEARGVIMSLRWDDICNGLGKKAQNHYEHAAEMLKR